MVKRLFIKIVNMKGIFYKTTTNLISFMSVHKNDHSYEQKEKLLIVLNV